LNNAATLKEHKKNLPSLFQLLGARKKNLKQVRTQKKVEHVGDAFEKISEQHKIAFVWS